MSLPGRVGRSSSAELPPYLDVSAELAAVSTRPRAAGRRLNKVVAFVSVVMQIVLTDGMIVVTELLLFF